MEFPWHLEIPDKQQTVADNEWQVRILLFFAFKDARWELCKVKLAGALRIQANLGS